METTERIVEAYARYVRGWATIPNIRCDGQYEIDLLAIDPVSLDRYHIEVGVSVSGSFSKLTANPFSPDDLKRRTRIAGARRTLGYFDVRKFGPEQVVAKLSEYGFKPGNYERVIVTWGWTDEAMVQAQASSIRLWDFRGLMQEIAESFERSRSYFTDDTLRTLSLFTHVLGHEQIKTKMPRHSTSQRSSTNIRGVGASEAFWIYENWVHNYVRLHKASCRHCNDGRGSHGSQSEEHGRWTGPFSNCEDALAHADQTGRDVSKCSVCC